MPVRLWKPSARICRKNLTEWTRSFNRYPGGRRSVDPLLLHPV